MTDVERTLDLCGRGMNCSQAILTVYGRSRGLDPETASKLGRPLGGGLGHSGLTCGAITAAALILGLMEEGPDEMEARKVVFHNVRQLFQGFEALHGTTECKDLLGADFSTPEGTKKIHDGNLTKTLCPGFVRDSASILEKLLTS